MQTPQSLDADPRQMQNPLDAEPLLLVMWPVMHAWKPPPSPVNRKTDRCKIISIMLYHFKEATKDYFAMGDVDNDGFMTFNEFKGMSERLEIPLYKTEVNIRHVKAKSLKICLSQKASKHLFFGKQCALFYIMLNSTFVRKFSKLRIPTRTDSCHKTCDRSFKTVHLMSLNICHMQF